ncbi:MAG: hypothetical protein M0Z91_07310 [Actinomycetota bacterium]|nr:hypothetical protein [Actinomycetota bacterium]
MLEVLGLLLGAIVNLKGTAHYFEWGVIQISYANLVVIILMLLVFVLAMAIPFPQHRSGRTNEN